MDLLRSLINVVLPATGVSTRGATSPVPIPMDAMPSTVQAALKTGQSVTATIQSLTPSPAGQGQNVTITFPQGGSATLSLPATMALNVGAELALQMGAKNTVTIGPLAEGALTRPVKNTPAVPAASPEGDWVFTQRGVRSVPRYGPFAGGGDGAMTPPKPPAMAAPAHDAAPDLAGLVLRVQPLSIPALRAMGIDALIKTGIDTAAVSQRFLHTASTPSPAAMNVSSTMALSPLGDEGAIVTVPPRTGRDGSGLRSVTHSPGGASDASPPLAPVPKPPTPVAATGSPTVSTVLSPSLPSITRAVVPSPQGAGAPSPTLAVAASFGARAAASALSSPTLFSGAAFSSPAPVLARVIDHPVSQHPSLLPPSPASLPIGSLAARVVAIDPANRLILTVLGAAAPVPALGADITNAPVAPSFVVTSPVANPPPMGHTLALYLIAGNGVLPSPTMAGLWGLGRSPDMTALLDGTMPAPVPPVMLMGAHPDPKLAAPLAGLVLGALARGTLVDLVRAKGHSDTQRLAIAQAIDNALTAATGGQGTGGPVAATDASGADFKTHLLPIWQDGAVHMVALHVRDHTHRNPSSRDDDDAPRDARPAVRFVFDLRLDRMGAVQLDGLYVRHTGAHRMDLTLRTECALDAQARDYLRALYARAMAQAGTNGDLHFQDTPDRFVTITPRKPLSGHEWQG